MRPLTRLAAQYAFTTRGKVAASLRQARDDPLSILRFGLNVAAWACVIITTKNFLVDVVPVHGSSMVPTLSPDFHATGRKDRVLFLRAMAARSARRGDVVSFWNPVHPEIESVKRVIATAGDVVVPDERYPEGRVTIPWGHVWVEGDNRHGRESYDSNYYGPISRQLITGRAVCIVRPVKRWQSVGKIPVESRTGIMLGHPTFPKELED